MACRHLFQIVLISIILDWLQELGGSDAIASLEKLNNLLKFVDLQTFAKKLRFYLNILGCQQEQVIHQTFKGLNLKAVLLQICHVILRW